MMKRTNLTFKEITEHMLAGKRVARKSKTFDGFVTRFRYGKESKRIIQLNQTYVVTYEASREDLEANDWYIIDN